MEPVRVLGGVPVFKPKQNFVTNVAGIQNTLLMDDGLRAYSNREREIKLRDDDNHYSALAHQLTGDFLYHYLMDHPLLLQGRVL